MHVVAQQRNDRRGHRTRFCTHSTLHQLAVHQLKTMPVRNFQQLFWCDAFGCGNDDRFRFQHTCTHTFTSHPNSRETTSAPWLTDILKQATSLLQGPPSVLTVACRLVVFSDKIHASPSWRKSVL